MTTSRRRFAPGVLAAIRDGRILGIRAGSEPHRFIGIWAVVVDGRVFVRSWGGKAKGWYRTFLEEPRGVINVGGRELRVRALPVRSERVRDAIDETYAEKYPTPGSVKYVRGFRGKRRRDTTTELVPR